ELDCTHIPKRAKRSVMRRGRLAPIDAHIDSFAGQPPDRRRHWRCRYNFPSVEHDAPDALPLPERLEIEYDFLSSWKHRHGRHFERHGPALVNEVQIAL